MLVLVPYSESRPLLEGNDRHEPAGSGKGGQFAKRTGLPAEPGTTPVPAGKIRVYHYTDSMDSVLTHGLDVTHARGSTYGEPNGIWASTAKPGDHKDYVEMHVTPEEIGLNGPYIRPTNYDGTKKSPEAILAEINNFAAGEHDFILNPKTMTPDRFVTTHEAWHDHARYIAKEYPPDNAAKVAEGHKFLDYLRTMHEGAPERQAVDWWYAEARKRGTLPPGVA